MRYDGEPIDGGLVRLVAPDAAAVAAAETGEVDDDGPWARWFGVAGVDDTIVYFGIEHEGAFVGEIFLHDIDLATGDACVGYRIHDPARRGLGLGRAALRTLTAWAAENVRIDRVFAIARADNLASCRIAERCGFEHTGPAREDPTRNVHRLVIRRRSSQAGR